MLATAPPSESRAGPTCVSRPGLTMVETLAWDDSSSGVMSTQIWPATTTSRAGELVMENGIILSGANVSLLFCAKANSS